jgi:hypothetical protein
MNHLSISVNCGLLWTIFALFPGPIEFAMSH